MITRETVGTYSQLPIRLAYAVTIHKSQGSTIDKATIIIGEKNNSSSQIFAAGQLYVGLSRIKDVKNLYIDGDLDTVGTLAAQEVKDFYHDYDDGCDYDKKASAIINGFINEMKKMEESKKEKKKNKIQKISNSSKNSSISNSKKKKKIPESTPENFEDEENKGNAEKNEVEINCGNSQFAVYTYAKELSHDTRKIGSEIVVVPVEIAEKVMNFAKYF